ncbi:MAG: S-layer homology domain-containing protein, partial [Candidatus Cryosericum sp.]
ASRWSFGFVEAAAKAGYVSGIGAGKFDPEATIKRQDVAVLLTRVLDKTTEAAKILEPICFANDESKISKFAVGPMTIAVRPRVQLLTWDKARNLRPAEPATRGECAFAVYNSVNPASSGKKTLVMADEEYPESLFPLTSDSAIRKNRLRILRPVPFRRLHTASSSPKCVRMYRRWRTSTLSATLMARSSPTSNCARGCSGRMENQSRSMTTPSPASFA